MSRIVQVANLVAADSQVSRVLLDELAAGYGAGGHEVIQILPAERPRFTLQPWGRRYELAGWTLPGTGLRVLGPQQVTRLLRRCGPDRLEVHDRTTLRGLGRWAREHEVGSLVVAHEAELGVARLAASFDRVVCTTARTAAGLARLDVPDVRVVPLGVDLDRFTPRAADAELRGRLVDACGVLLASVVRLTPEKRPTLGVLTVAELIRRGLPVSFAIAGDGPMRRQVAQAADGLPVRVLGHLASQSAVAALLATADVLLAPGPVETFGLAAVEALACGTPVVVDERSALSAVVGGAGVAAPATPQGFADGVQELLGRPLVARTRAARARAAEFGWARTVAGFLDAHGLTRPAAAHVPG